MADLPEVPPNRYFNLKASGAIFPVKKRHLMEHLRLFQDNPSLLNEQEYEVQTRVRTEVFSAFARMLTGGEIVVSEDTCESFRSLSEEFGFEALSDACAEFAESRQTADHSLAKRVNALEEQLLSREREFARLRERFALLENKGRSPVGRYLLIFSVVVLLFAFLGREKEKPPRHRLSLSLADRIGIEEDPNRAVEYYRLSAEQGNAYGQHRFGYCLEHGIGIDKDLNRAVEYYRLSAEQGNS
jgi:hypothetical protein